MLDLTQYKMLMLAALTGYAGTLLRGIPTQIINFCFYWFGYTISTATDIGWDSYMGLYMGIRKIVPKYKKYYNHMGSIMKIKRSMNMYINVDSKIDGYNYLTEEEQNIINNRTSSSSRFDFLNINKKQIHCYIDAIKQLPSGSHLIYLGNFTWIRIFAATEYKQNSQQQNGSRPAYGPQQDDPNPVNHKISIALFGFDAKKYMKVFKDTEKWWTDYMSGDLFKENVAINNVVDLIKYYNQSMENKFTEIIQSYSGGFETNYYKPNRTMDSIFLDNKNEILNAFKSFLTLDTLRKYQSLEIPYKLNVLLYGKPGTGKTSLLYALANELTVNKQFRIVADPVAVKNKIFTNGGLIPYDFDPSDVSYNEKIVNILPNFHFKLNAFNVIEEIDTLFSSITTINREKDNGKTSFEDLLSNSTGNLKAILEWLDGSTTPFGNVCICTTNYIEKLDPALIRRFDYIFHIDGISNETVEEMLKYYGFDHSILNKFQKEDYVMDNGLVNPSKLSNLLIKEMKGDIHESI